MTTNFWNLSLVALGLSAACGDPDLSATTHPCEEGVCGETDSDGELATSFGMAEAGEATSTGATAGEPEEPGDSDGRTSGNEDGTTTFGGVTAETGSTTGGSFDDTQGTGATDTMGTTGDTQGTGTTDAGTSGETEGVDGGPDSVCGDGMVGPDEACDDGMDNGTYDHCAADWSGMGEHCGDNRLQMGEQCDDGNRGDNDGCDADCVPSRVDAIASGEGHNCVLLRTGDVKCWGQGGRGLGYGNRENIGDDETPADVGVVNVGAKVTQLALANNVTCALLVSGDVKCWGSAGGFLGYGNTDPVGLTNTPADVGVVPLGVGRTALSITGRAAHVCALLDDRTVKCWGAGAEGRLGQGNTATIGDDETPAEVAPVELGGRVRSVVAGGRHTCVVMEARGGVRCWGADSYGQLGNGPRVTEDLGDQPDEVNRIVDVPVLRGPLLSAGWQFSCAAQNGQVGCWGRSDLGQLGRGSGGGLSAPTRSPVSVLPEMLGASIEKLVSGGRHTCVLDSAERLRCWGSRHFGQSGTPTAHSQVGLGERPGDRAEVLDFGDDANGNPLRVRDVAAGWDHTCVVLSNGAVRCWGRNETNTVLGRGRQVSGAMHEDPDIILLPDAIDVQIF